AILPGKSPEQLKYLGENSVIGSGAVVVKHTEPNKVYIGSPAKELSRD
ncbi:sugar O-acyltransferase, sialic acid O-acetyltransferase NeuD family domain protein, partial [Acinetobacter baumannii 25691_8]